MAKLTDEALAEGRARIAESDLEGLMEWVRTNAPGVFTEDSLFQMERTYRLTLMVPDLPRALKLFNRTFEEMDPQAEVAAGKLAAVTKAGCLVFVGLGLLGGVVYLVRSLLGL